MHLEFHLGPLHIILDTKNEMMQGELGTDTEVVDSESTSIAMGFRGTTTS